MVITYPGRVRVELGTLGRTDHSLTRFSDGKGERQRQFAQPPYVCWWTFVCWTTLTGFFVLLETGSSDLALTHLHAQVEGLEHCYSSRAPIAQNSRRSLRRGNGSDGTDG